MGVLTRGTTYTTASTVTAANLEALIESATVSGLKRQHFLSSEHFPITADTAPPSSLETGEMWVDTDTGLYKVYNGTKSVAAFADAVEAKARAGETIPVGTAVGVVSTGSTWVVRPTTAGTQANFLGVAIEEITDTTAGFVQIKGQVDVLVSGAIQAGAFLVAVGTDGKLEGSGTTLGGQDDEYAIALEDRIGGAATIKAWLIQ